MSNLAEAVAVGFLTLRTKRASFALAAIYWLSLVAYLVFVLHSIGFASHAWGILWLLAIVTLMFAPLLPTIGPLVYLIVAYSVPRYSHAADLLRSVALPESIAYFALAALVVATWAHGGTGRLGGYRGWLMIALWSILVISAVHAIGHGRPWDPLNEHPLGQFNQALILFFLALRTLATRAGAIALSSTLLLTLLIRVSLSDIQPIRGDHDISFFSVVVFPFLLVPALICARGIARGATFTITALPLVAIIGLSRNRGALIGLAGTLLALWMSSKRKVLYAAVAAVMLLSALPFVPWKDYLGRFATAGTDQSSQSRLHVWTAGLRMVARNSVFGVGLGNFQPESLRYGENPLMGAEVAHNNFLHMAAEGGVFALAAYVALLLATFATGIKLARNPDPWLRLSGRVIEASMVGYLLAGQFISRHNFVLAYLIMGWSAGLAASLRKADRRQPS